jgi:excisionase family DNA binding protein
MPRYLTTTELSRQLRCSEKTIRRHVAAGRLPASQFTEGGRFLFDVREVRDVIRQHRKTQPAAASL